MTARRSKNEKAKPSEGESPKRNRVGLVVQALGQKIVAQEYAPGDALPTEPELAEELGVGRTALREAIKILSGKGLLGTAPRRGTHVSPAHEWNMLDPDVISWNATSGNAKRFLDEIFELRRLIEPEAAALAAKRATRREVADLLAAVEEMEIAVEREEQLKADLHFHSLLIHCSHNSILASFRSALTALLRADFEIAMKVPRAFEHNIVHHLAVAEAVASGDSEAARAAAAQLIDANVRDVSSAIRDRPGK